MANSRILTSAALNLLTPCGANNGGGRNDLKSTPDSSRLSSAPSDKEEHSPRIQHALVPPSPSRFDNNPSRLLTGRSVVSNSRPISVSETAVVAAGASHSMSAAMYANVQAIGGAFGHPIPPSPPPLARVISTRHSSTPSARGRRDRSKASVSPRRPVNPVIEQQGLRLENLTVTLPYSVMSDQEVFEEERRSIQSVSGQDE